MIAIIDNTIMIVSTEKGTQEVLKKFKDWWVIEWAEPKLFWNRRVLWEVQFRHKS